MSRNTTTKVSTPGTASLASKVPGFLENLENGNLGCQRGGSGGADLRSGIPAHKSGDRKD